MSGFGEILTAAQGHMLGLRPVIIVGWRDGPIEGIARLSVGESLWSFRLFAEGARSDDLNERLFLFSELPEDASISWLRNRVTESSLPLVWPFDDQSDRADLESTVDAVLEAARPARLVVASSDFETVLQAWMVSSSDG